MERKVGKVSLTIERGDLTLHSADAIVNAANPSLLPGGGVCGAIHRAGGPSIAEECAQVRRRRGDCATGDAVATTAGDLPARTVFHAVGPVWRGGGEGEEILLASAYRACLRLADEHSLASMAFPSISTGIFGYPVTRAAGTAMEMVRDYVTGRPTTSLTRITWVLFDDVTYDAYAAVLGELYAEGQGRVARKARTRARRGT